MKDTNMTTKIETTAAVRRFNRAVERADALLGPAVDQWCVPHLLEELGGCNPVWASAGRELLAAHNDLETVKQIPVSSGKH